MESLQKQHSYSFTYEFEYIQHNYGGDRYDVQLTTMEVDVEWDEAQQGYTIDYRVPYMLDIDPSRGNGDAAEFFEMQVEPRLRADLSAMGIPAEAIVA